MTRRVVPPRRKEEIQGLKNIVDSDVAAQREHRIQELASTLDIGPKALKKLEKKHGAKLLATLERWHKETRERPRFMAKQQGRVLRDQYVETAIAAIDDVEAVPEDDQRIITMTAHARWAEVQQREHAQQRAHDGSKQLGKQIRDVAVSIARQGGDPLEFLASIQRDVSAKRGQIRDVA